MKPEPYSHTHTILHSSKRETQFALKLNQYKGNEVEIGIIVSAGAEHLCSDVTLLSELWWVLVFKTQQG